MKPQSLSPSEVTSDFESKASERTACNQWYGDSKVGLGSPKPVIGLGTEALNRAGTSSL